MAHVKIYASSQRLCSPLDSFSAVYEDCPSKIAFDHDTLLVTGWGHGQYYVEVSSVCCLQLIVTHAMEDPLIRDS